MNQQPKTGNKQDNSQRSPQQGEKIQSPGQSGADKRTQGQDSTRDTDRRDQRDDVRK